LAIRLCLIAATIAPDTSWISKKPTEYFWKRRKFGTKWYTRLCI